MNALETILYSLAFIGAWTCLSSLTIYLRDRSGNSGRSSHWAINPRIKSPMDDDDEIYRAMAANLELVEGFCPRISDAEVDRELARARVKALYAKVNPEAAISATNQRIIGPDDRQ